MTCTALLSKAGGMGAPPYVTVLIVETGLRLGRVIQHALQHCRHHAQLRRPVPGDGFQNQIHLRLSQHNEGAPA